MYNSKIIITFCLLFISFQIFSQKIGGVLSKEEMYKEYDYLTDLMQNANPHLQIYKKVMNLDIISEMKELRQDIDTINSLSSYYILLNRVLVLIPEIHTRLLRYKDLLSVAEAFIRKGHACNAQEIIFHIQSIVKKFNNCRKCPHKV